MEILGVISQELQKYLLDKHAKSQIELTDVYDSKQNPVKLKSIQ